MKRTPGKTEKLGKVKVCKYSAESGKFLGKYVDKLVEIGFLKPCPQALGQAATHLVPNDSRSKFRITTNLRAVNVATEAEQWPMPVIEAELSYFTGSSHFASLNFVWDIGCVHWILHHTMRAAFNASRGTLISTLVRNGLKVLLSISDRLYYNYSRARNMHSRHELVTSQSIQNLKTN